MMYCFKVNATFTRGQKVTYFVECGAGNESAAHDMVLALLSEPYDCEVFSVPFATADACKALYTHIKAYMAGGWADCPLCNLLDHDEDCPFEMAKRAIAGLDETETLARARADSSGEGAGK